MDGSAYLEKLIADQLAVAERRLPAERGLHFDLAHVRGVAVGLVAAGAMRQQDMDRVIADLERRLERLGWLTRRRATLTAAPIDGASLTVEMRRQLVLNSALHREQPAALAPPPQLEQVIALHGRAIAVGAVTAGLVSLERWSTMFVLRLASFGPWQSPTGEPLLIQRVRWRGWDDAGTQYRSAGAGGWARHDVQLADVILEPGAPTGARTLTLDAAHHGQHHRFTIDLDS